MDQRVSVAVVYGKLFLGIGARAGGMKEDCHQQRWAMTAGSSTTRRLPGSALYAATVVLLPACRRIVRGPVSVIYSQRFFLNTSSNITAMLSITPSKMK